MGGVAIDPGDSDSFIPESKRSTLTPNGISLLLKHEPQLLPDISEEDVKDKSKGSSFTKFVACIQAAWFCLSCIARLSQKLPVSMLEINTFAHACCSVIVYILVRDFFSIFNYYQLFLRSNADIIIFQWWRKPMDVERPLVVQADGMRQLLAYMWMASKTSCIPKPASSGHERITVGRDPEFEAIIDERTSSADGTIDSRAMHATPMTIDSISPAVNVPSTGTVSGAGSPTIKITTTQDLPGTGFRVNGQSTRWKVTTMTGDGSEGGDVRTDVYYKPAVFNLTPCDVRRWQLAREAIDKYRLKKPNTNLNLVTVRALPESVNLDESTGEGEEKPNFLACLGLSLVGAGYGGLHALAWNAHFPSHKELKLWRISVLIIAAPAALVFLFFLLSLIAVLLMLIFWFNDPKTDPNPKKPTEMPPPNTSVAIKENSSTLETISELLIGVPLGCAVIFLYLPARGYLVYESFRTVFFLPAAAYATTNWLQYFPHIT